MAPKTFFGENMFLPPKNKFGDKPERPTARAAVTEKIAGLWPASFLWVLLFLRAADAPAWQTARAAGVEVDVDVVQSQG